MGCASSKQKRCRHCQTPYSPVPRSYSMHVHHPSQGKGDSYHVVALTSTTLGFRKLDFKNQNNNNNNNHVDINGDDHHFDCGDDNNLKSGHCNGDAFDKEEDSESKSKSKSKSKSEEFSLGLVEAKVWSTMIEEKIPKVVPKTPIRTPPGEPETINTWELMEGLEDMSPLRSPNHIRSFSFDVVRDTNPPSPVDRPKSKLSETVAASPKSMWFPMADGDDKSSNCVSEFDPEVISTFRRSFQELSPRHPFHLRPLENEKQPPLAGNELLLDSFEAKKVNGVALDHQKCVKEKVVVYFTSLRGVRKTYEDCCHVRVILKSLGVRVDERDVSMHSGFKEELKVLLGDHKITGGGLPRVFVGKNYIGGADEIRRMHEEGQLEKAFEGCEMLEDCGGVNLGGACEACGDIRFVPCETCSGSCKIYYERDDEDEEAEEEWEGDDGEDGEFGFQRCPDCNENGLIRCPMCCY